jgi:hypothetical protein
MASPLLVSSDESDSAIILTQKSLVDDIIG